MGGVDEREAATHTAGSSDGAAQTSTEPGVPVNRRLPQAVLNQLPSLSHRPWRLPVIAHGRCSVASVLLAIRFILDAHINDRGRRTIDRARRGLGRVLVDKWTEAEWIRRVPIDVRAAHKPYVNNTDPTDVRRHSSYKIYHQLLTEAAPTTWLDHAVFYLASFDYEVGICVIYQEVGGEWYCKQIGKRADSYIVLYHVCGHYEPIEYDGLRQFPSDHKFITRVSEFAARHPEQPYEEDVELQALKAHEQERAQTSAADMATPPKRDTQLSPVRLVTRKAASAGLASRRAASKQRSKSKAKRANDLTGEAVELIKNGHGHERCNRTEQRRRQTAATADCSGSAARPAVRACVVPQPATMACSEPLWNAYRLASMNGQRSQLTAILLTYCDCHSAYCRSWADRAERQGVEQLRRLDIDCAVRLSDCVRDMTALIRTRRMGSKHRCRLRLWCILQLRVGMNV